MLYDRWRQVSAQYASDTALHDLDSGRQWTFRQLAEEVERLPAVEGSVAFPQGQSADFVLAVLGAWRDGKILCPLEPGQTTPALSGLPAGVAHVKVTSGTTGAPRFVLFTEEQIAADAANIVATMGLRPDRPNLGVISLAHSYGYSNLITPLLLHGIPLYVAGSPLPDPVRRALELRDAWTLPAVPALWQTWLNTDALNGRVKLAISAGAALPLQLEREVFDKCGIKIHNFLGSSECGGIAYEGSDLPREDTTFAGSPMSGVTVDLNDEGCLRISGPAVGTGYLPEGSDALANGVFQTQDLAEIHEGQIYLRGRMGDLINVAGRKVAPEAIEEALLDHPSVKSCAVFAVPSESEVRNDQIVAFVVGETADQESLRRHVAERLPSWQVPRHWEFVERLPINARGKVSRAELRKTFIAGR